VLLFVLGPPLPAAMALLVLAGTGTSAMIGLDQLTVAALPEEVRRRGFALLQAGMMVTQGLGFAAAGAAAEWLPVTTVIPVAGICGLAVVLVAGHRLRRAHPAARRPDRVAVG
jgi:hypothetical protein